MTGDLQLATRVHAVGEGSFELIVPDGWQQGRGAFGGLTIAAMVRAVEAFAAAPDRPLRSLTVSLPAPAALGRHTIRVDTLRAGSGQSTLAAQAGQGDDIAGTCVAVLGRARAQAQPEFCDLPRPALRSFRDMEPLPRRMGGPVFSQHFEYRLNEFIPFSGSPTARTLGWVRPRECSDGMSSAAYLAAVSDAWWPAMFTRATAPMAVATVAFTLQVLNHRPIDPSVPLAFRGHGFRQHEGYCVEQRELWSDACELLALNQQTFAIIK